MHTHEFEVPETLEGERVDRAISILTDMTRSEATSIVESGNCTLNGRVVRSKSTRIHRGESLHILFEERAAASEVVEDPEVVLEVVYNDKDIAVVDKRAGQIVHPGAGVTSGTMVSGLVHLFPDARDVGESFRPGVVHRLDKGTSGLMVFALSEIAYHSLVGQISSREVHREYLALVEGELESPKGKIDAPLARSDRDHRKMEISTGGKEALTYYQLLEVIDGDRQRSLVKVILGTGRTHQIRVHLAALGHPVVGDSLYGREIECLGRPFLHSRRLAFRHPTTDVEHVFECEMPDDLLLYLDTLRSAAFE